MMPNVVRGDRMAGLLVYLAGQGKRNEHTEPHVVAGDNHIMAMYADTELSRNDALAIAKQIDRPRQWSGTEVRGGHVWHCSLSLRAEEGLQTDEKWGEIATDFMSLMGFNDAEGTKAPLRWVAVRHGLSQNGNDHIHLAVNLIREDGTKADIWRDWPRAQKAARELEVKYGLQELESAAQGRSTRGYEPAEREAQARARARAKYERSRLKSDGVGVPWVELSKDDRAALIASEMTVDEPRYLLARKVRGCATASQDEAEFVRRCRRAGLLVRPRFAEGRQDVVTGYSIASRPVAGERPIWYGGGNLGHDLTLPRLRAEWPDSPSGASDAAAEWYAAYRGRRVVNVGREAREPGSETIERMHTDMRGLREQLRDVPLDDSETWARVARHTAGAFSAWSNAVEDTPGELAHIADVLSRSAQTKLRPVQPKPAGMASIGAAAMVLAMTSAGGGGAAQMVTARLLENLMRMVFNAAVAARDLRQAEAIRLSAVQQVKDVHARLELQLAGAPARAPGMVSTVRVEASAAHTLPAASESVFETDAPATTEDAEAVVDPEWQATLDRLKISQPPTGTTLSPLPNKLSPKTDRPYRSTTSERGGIER